MPKTTDASQKRRASRKLHHPPKSLPTRVQTLADPTACVGCGSKRETTYPICNYCSQRNRS